MANENEIRTAIDAGRLNTKLSILAWILSAIMLIVCIIMSSVRGGSLFMLNTVPFALALLFGLGSMVYAMLFTSASQENEEKELLLRRRTESRALDVDEDVRFTAGRSFENYKRFAPYVLSVMGALLLGIILFFCQRTWSQIGGIPAISGNPVDYALIAAVMMLVAIFAGAFFIGQSRTANFRWLRPVGAWLVVGFASLACTAIAAICYKNNLLKVDYTIAKVFFWIFAILGAEFISNFIIEFYRPRTIIETRPVFESRILALFTEPGGVMRNIASALDYQFGFKVSSTTLYAFVEKAFFPLILLWAAIFWLSTTICEVGPNELGIRESFGKVTSKELLKPGIYFTLPRPFGTVRTISCTKIHRVVIGEFEDHGKQAPAQPETPDDGHGHSKPKADPNAGKPKQVLSWTDSHGSDEDNFIVAVPTGKGKSASPEEEAASISFLRLSIPIQYKVRPDGVMNYLYANADSRSMLIRIGERVATRYLATSSVMEIIATGRSKAESDMKKMVQQLADEAALGIEITAVNILGAHPPVGDVASAFQNVISAMEEKETTILGAKSYKTTTLPESEAMAAELIAGANSYKYRTSTVARAENKRFGNQLVAFKAMPEMFVLRSYLDFLRDDCSHIRKYVTSPNFESGVYQINLEQKERLDLTDADIASVPSN